jgi:hypothetical protein
MSIVLQFLLVLGVICAAIKFVTAPHSPFVESLLPWFYRRSSASVKIAFQFSEAARSTGLNVYTDGFKACYKSHISLIGRCAHRARAQNRQQGRAKSKAMGRDTSKAAHHSVLTYFNHLA